MLGDGGCLLFAEIECLRFVFAQPSVGLFWLKFAHIVAMVHVANVWWS